MLCKRIGDVVGSMAMLIVFSPLMLIITFAVAVTMGRPVIFRQSRLGWRGKRFDILKFRTMRDCRDASGAILPDCERVTRLGCILRDWSLDELPQLINVLRGDMSLVGPRPMLDEFVCYCTNRQLRRYQVRPGITGLAQIRGRKNLDYEKRFELDIQYVDNVSLLMDLKILFGTPLMVLSRCGHVETGEALAAPADQSVLNPISLEQLPDEREIASRFIDIGK